MVIQLTDEQREEISKRLMDKGFDSHDVEEIFGAMTDPPDVLEMSSIGYSREDIATIRKCHPGDYLLGYCQCFKDIQQTGSPYTLDKTISNQSKLDS